MSVANPQQRYQWQVAERPDSSSPPGASLSYGGTGLNYGIENFDNVCYYKLALNKRICYDMIKILHF